MNNKCKFSRLAAAAIAIPLLFCSCGASSSDSELKSNAVASYDSYDGYDSYDVYETTAAYNYDYAEENYMDAASNDNSNVQATSEKITRKIIKDASLTVSSDNAKSSYDTYIAKITELGGYEFSRELYENQGYISIVVTMKVPPEHLDEAVDFAEECGNVTNVTVSSDDITSSYYDTEIRLENKRKNLEKYYELLENAYAMEDIIQIQNEIDRITSEIETAEGQLRLWNSLVGESTLNIRFYESAAPLTEEIDWDTITPSEMLQLMGNGFKSVASGLVKFLQWLLIIVVSASPILIVIFIVVMIIVAIARKNNAKRAKKAAAAAENVQPIKNPQPEKAAVETADAENKDGKQE